METSQAMAVTVWSRVWRCQKADTDVEEVELADVPDTYLNTGQHDDVEVEQAQNPHHSWQRVITFATVVAAVVLIANITLATVAVLNSRPSNGVGNIFEGDCALVGQWNTALHLLINITSTALLAASNYTMQCLNSPTRIDVDGAHASGTSLDIGLPSIRNLRYLPYWKGFVWLALCLSSLPLHLFWNSTIFTAYPSNQVGVVVVDQDFLNAAGSAHPNYTQCFTDHHKSTDLSSFIYDKYSAGNYHEVSWLPCGGLLDPTGSRSYTESESYATSTDHRNIIVVSSIPLNLTTTQCNYTGNLTSMSHAGSASSYNLSHCLVETKGLHNCTLNLSFYLLYVVIICNAIKVACMIAAATLLWNSGGSILVTVGDAAASFIEHPDEFTENRCVADRARSALGIGSSMSITTTYMRSPLAKVGEVARTQRRMSNMVGAVYMLGGAVGLHLVATALPLDSRGKSTWEPRPASRMELIQMTMLVNTPQVILSLTYYQYNALISAQCGAFEWAKYANEMKGLRVSWPRGYQRSTYWLSLPYRHGIPSSIILAFVHFSLSQTIKITCTRTFDQMGNAVEPFILPKIVQSDQNGSGMYMFSPLVMGSLMLLRQFFFAHKYFDNHMPYHKNSSAMISALCHVNDPYGLGRQYSSRELRDIAARPLTWGVTREPVQVPLQLRDHLPLGQLTESEHEAMTELTNVQFVNGGSDGVMKTVPGHCGFSTGSVGKPVKGERYE